MIYLDYPSISPIIFSIGPFEIRWYSMAYIIGFLFAWQYIKFLSNKKELHGFKTNLDSRSVDDLIFYSIIGLIIGARLAYVIFYNKKTIESKKFINIYEFSSIFKDEIVIFKKFRDEKKVNKKRLGKDDRNT